MQRPTYPRRNNKTFRQQGDGREMELERLHRDVRNLTELLESERQHCCKEKNERLLISQELEQTKQNLAKQKALKEMYINRGKDTRRELERLEKYSKDETLCSFNIAQKVNDTNRQKKKKDLHADYEELKVAHLVSTEKFTKELQSEKEKNKVLQEELDSSKVSHNELKLRYETDMLAAKQLVETLQRENEQQRQAHAETVSQGQQVISTLRAELDVLGQKATEEIAVLQQAAFEMEMMNITELEGLKTQLSDQKVIKEQYEELKVAYYTSQDKFTAELQQVKDNSKLLQGQLEEFRVSNEELSRRYQTDVVALTQAESRQKELEAEIQSVYNTVANNQLSIWNLNTEKVVLQQKMEERINTLQQINMERESIQCEEVKELKTQIQHLISQNMELSSELEAHREDYMPPRRKRASREETQGELSCMEVTIPHVTAEAPGTSGLVGPTETVRTSGPVGPTETVGTLGPVGPTETVGTSGPVGPTETVGTSGVTGTAEATGAAETMQPQEPAKEMSRFKQFRHLLGLRKPQSWKKKKEPSSLSPQH